MTLRELIHEYGANAYVFADEGSGSAFGEAGQAVFYDDKADEAFGDIPLYRLAEPHTSVDGIEFHYASEWRDKVNGYRFRIFF